MQQVTEGILSSFQYGLGEDGDGRQQMAAADGWKHDGQSQRRV